MTEQEHGHGADACGADVAAYALGALSAEEAAAFEQHLGSCTVCSAELASFQIVVDALPLTVPHQRAPRALRRRVLSTIRQEAAGATRGQQRAGWAAMVRGAGARPLAGATALLAAAAVAVGVIELTGSGTSARVYQAQVTGPGSAEVTLHGTRGELAVRDFSVPSKGHVYEVWLLKRGSKAPVPARALFNVSGSGDGSVKLPDELHHGDQILVSTEPAGGSPHPTTTPVMSVQLS